MRLQSRKRWPMFVGLIAAVLLAAMANRAWMSPMAPEPLVNEAGVELDSATAAKLLAIVFEAARQDDVVTIDEFLKSGFSPNVRSAAGDTLLTVAAYHDSYRAVERLLAAPGVDVEARSRMGLTAIAGAAFKGNERSLRLLILSGADVDAAGSLQRTALMFASLSGRANVAQLLLEAGADAGRVDAAGNTAASLAHAQGAEDVISILTP